MIESGCFTFVVCQLHMETKGHLLKDNSMHLKFTMRDQIEVT